MDYFQYYELTCPCNQCRVSRTINAGLLIDLNRARGLLDEPMKITSGVRCPDHNRAIGGAPNSSHMTGWAVDIRVDNDRYRWDLLHCLIAAGFTRIGIYPKHIHVDKDPHKREKRIWVGS